VTFELLRRYRFEAAHWLPAVPDAHRCSRMHGHTYGVEVRLRGAEHPDTGWVVDFADIDAACEPAIAELDHRLLNDIPGLENPTSEGVACWLWGRIAPALPGLHSVTVAENEDSMCTYWGPEQ
jgi:6-pyruvoyltetrahydropterin/6-carboxytetrahydropterin synthase